MKKLLAILTCLAIFATPTVVMAAELNELETSDEVVQIDKEMLEYVTKKNSLIEKYYAEKMAGKTA